MAASAAPALADVQIILGGPQPSPKPAAHALKKPAAKPAAQAVARPVEPEMITIGPQQPAGPSAAYPPAAFLPAPVRASGAAVTSAIRGQFIQTAMRYIGVPYVWGGASPDGFDCSGFVQYTLAAVGVRVPRTADDQFYALPPTDDPRPGDLVFFQTYLPGPSHVGIYIGNGYFVNSIGSNVQVSSFASSYFTSRYLGARRVFE